MSVSREHVVWVYRTLLRRDPENEDVIAEQMRSYDDRVDLILSVVNSEEFLVNHRHVNA